MNVIWHGHLKHAHFVKSQGGLNFFNEGITVYLGEELFKSAATSEAWCRLRAVLDIVFSVGARTKLRELFAASITLERYLLSCGLSPKQPPTM